MSRFLPFPSVKAMEDFLAEDDGREGRVLALKGFLTYFLDGMPRSHVCNYGSKILFERKLIDRGLLWPEDR